jgi:hypothetical protein
LPLSPPLIAEAAAITLRHFMTRIDTLIADATFFLSC